MRVTFVAGDLSLGGGVNRAIMNLSGVLAQQVNAEVTVIGVGTRDRPTYEFSPNVRVVTEVDGRPVRWLDAIRLIRREKPQYVIGSWTQSNLFLAVALLNSGVNLVAVEHGSWNFHPKWIRRLRRIIYPLAWRIVVLNPKDLGHYRRVFSRVRLIPNLVTDVCRTPTVTRAKLILAIGHLQPHKNLVDAIRAMSLARLEENGWHMAIIGAGPEEALLRNEIRDARLTRTTIYPPTSNIDQWYNRASLMLVTSKLEVFSLVLAEGMSAGVVPVAYAADGPSFILEDFPDHLVPVGDVEGLAKRLRSFALGQISDSIRSDMADSIGTRFSKQAVAEKWLELFSER